jgi:UPF0271 protein
MRRCMMFYTKMDINADAGESFGNYKYGNDEELMKHLTSVNVACGFHAGDPRVMRKTVRLAKKYGVAIGAHPGFPDLMGFGRRNLDITPDEMRDYIVYQVGALKAFVEAEGMKLNHVGPHGAVAALGRRVPEVAEAFVDGVREVDPKLILLGRPGLPTYDIAQKRGLRVASQVGLDIDYRPDKTAVIQREKQEMAPEEALRRLKKIIQEGSVLAVDGSKMDFRVDTLLVHGDTPNAIELCKVIRAELTKMGVEITSFGNFV